MKFRKGVGLAGHEGKRSHLPDSLAGMFLEVSIKEENVCNQILVGSRERFYSGKQLTRSLRIAKTGPTISRLFAIL